MNRKLWVAALVGCLGWFSTSGAVVARAPKPPSPDSPFYHAPLTSFMKQKKKKDKKSFLKKFLFLFKIGIGPKEEDEPKVQLLPEKQRQLQKLPGGRPVGTFRSRR